MRGEVEDERHGFAALRRQHGNDEKHVGRGFDDVDRTRAAFVQRVAGQASPLQASVGEEFENDRFIGLKRDLKSPSPQSVGARLTVDR